MPLEPVELPFRTHAWDTWRAKYGRKPPWMKKDFVLLEKALKTIGDETTARRAWDIYLRCTEPFFSGHSPGKFVKELSRWVAAVPRVVLRSVPKPTELEAKMTEMARISAEVENDESIPESQKKDEKVKRWREAR